MAIGEHVNMRIFRFTSVLAFCFLTSFVKAQPTIWAPNGETEFTGKAIDQATEEAVPHAWVLGIYVLGRGGVHEQAHCTVAELVQSDELGQYVLPYYDGLPPQFLYAFAHRYKYAQPLRDVYKDAQLRPIVRVMKLINGRPQIVGREGPFRDEQEALKASRTLQDVWLERFTGTDDEWLGELLRTPKQSGCPSKKTSGMVGWAAELLKEAERMPDSGVRRDIVDRLEFRLAQEKKWNPDGAKKLEMGVIK
jgi:hypothetical protein